jgi:hypothetical protein
MEHGSSGTHSQAWTSDLSDRFRCPAPLWPFRTKDDLPVFLTGAINDISGDPAAARVSGETVAIRTACDEDPTVRRA